MERSGFSTACAAAARPSTNSAPGHLLYQCTRKQLSGGAELLQCHPALEAHKCIIVEHNHVQAKGLPFFAVPYQGSLEKICGTAQKLDLVTYWSK